jgi:hypothetical protein
MTLDLSTLKSAKVDPNEPMMRLMKCLKCKTIDEIPGYSGPEGGENTVEFDEALRFFVDQHIDKGCTNRDDRVIYYLPVRFWVIPKVKKGILKQIQQGAEGLDIFGTNFYATKENFTADAMTCWIAHKQTKDCGDYKNDKKLLKADTAKERLDAGLEKESSGPKVYLCDYCPVKSIVQEKAFKQQGLYN